MYNWKSSRLLQMPPPTRTIAACVVCFWRLQLVVNRIGGETAFDQRLLKSAGRFSPNLIEVSISKWLLRKSERNAPSSRALPRVFQGYGLDLSALLASTHLLGIRKSTGLELTQARLNIPCNLVIRRSPALHVLSSNTIRVCRPFAALYARIRGKRRPSLCAGNAGTLGSYVTPANGRCRRRTCHTLAKVYTYVFFARRQTSRQM